MQTCYLIINNILYHNYVINVHTFFIKLEIIRKCGAIDYNKVIVKNVF